MAKRTNKSKPAARKPARKPAAPAQAKPGPAPELLKLDGDWEDAVKKSMAKKKPAKGWPKGSE